MCNPIMWTTRYLETTVDRLGWDARADADGDVVVETRVGRFVIANTAPSDPEYLHAYSLWPIPGDVGRANLTEIAAEVTLEAKGVAVALLKGTDAVVFTYEAVVVGPDCLPSVDQLGGVLPRVQRMLWNAVGLWLTKAKDASELAGIQAATQAALADGSDG